ncbi:MAG: apolipoprotein N-acyltransferase [Myxococcota bacterium]
MTPRSPATRRVALALYALATLLSFPHEIPVLGAFDLGLVFAWLGPAALVVGLDGSSPRAAARAGFLASLAAHVVLFHWFIVVTVGYGGMPLALGLLSPLLPAYWVAQFSALFAACWARFAHRPGAVLLGACAWVAIDWLRGWFLGGFPWATLGYALHRDVPLLAFTRYGGVYALSFFAALVGLALGRLILRRRGGRAGVARSAAAVAAFAAGVHLVGALLPVREDPDPARIRIAAIQGNIDQGEKWDAARRERILESYLRLSEAAGAQGADWIVWPETAIPGSLEWDPELRRRIAALAERYGALLILGGMGIEFAPGGDGPSAYYDSAFVVGRDGVIQDRYDKTQLVPFGEFVPLRGLLGRVFHSLARGLSPSDVTPGAAPRALELAGEDPEAAPLRAGVPICYELLFPDLVRRFAADGAGVLLAVTNDAWYGRTGAPHQFLAMTAMRSAETARYTVRAANTGISAIIDDRGRVLERSALFEEAVIVADVPVARSAPATFYARFGDVFAWTCILGALAGLLGDRLRPRSMKGMSGNER